MQTNNKLWHSLLVASSNIILPFHPSNRILNFFSVAVISDERLHIRASLAVRLGHVIFSNHVVS